MPYNYTTVCMGRSGAGGVDCSGFNCNASVLKRFQPAEQLASSHGSKEPPPRSTLRRPDISYFQSSFQAAANYAPILSTVDQPDSPLRVSHAKANIDGSTVSQLSYDLENVGAKPVVASSIQVLFRTKDGEESSIVMTNDHFMGRSDLAPGNTRHQDFNLKLQFKSPITKVELSVGFAMVEGGTIPDSTMRVTYVALMARWREELGLYNRVADALLIKTDAMSDQEIRDILKEYSLKHTWSDAVAIIADVLSSEGVPAVKNLVNHPRPLW